MLDMQTSWGMAAADGSLFFFFVFSFFFSCSFSLLFCKKKRVFGSSIDRGCSRQFWICRSRNLSCLPVPFRLSTADGGLGFQALRSAKAIRQFQETLSTLTSETQASDTLNTVSFNTISTIA